MQNSPPAWFWWLILLAVAGLDLLLARWLSRRLARRRAERPSPLVEPGTEVFIFGRPSFILTWLRNRHFRLERVTAIETSPLAHFLSLKAWQEAALLVLWTLFVGRRYLDFSPGLYPTGGEFAMVTQTHTLWRLLPQCGLCVLWNGFFNGGAPAFAETHGAVLHPLVILTTLLFGVVNGSKVLLLVCLAAAGLSQWWLARMMGVGRAARLWVGAMAVMGGNLAGKMEIGNVNLVLALVSASLVMTCAMGLALTGRRGYLVALSLTLAGTWLAGQGYIQIGLVGGLLPPLVVFFFQNHRAPATRPFWRDVLAAFLISILLAAVFWLPVMHFWPNFDKDRDPGLANLQPLAYLPFNLVINDLNFFNKMVLGLDQNHYTHLNYLGWGPLLLALAGLRLAPRRNGRLVLYLWLTTGLVFLVTSQDLLVWLSKYLPQVTYLRNYSVATGLVFPPLLALAAWGAQGGLLASGPALVVQSPGRRRVVLLSTVLTGLVMVLSILPEYNFSSTWLDVAPFNVPVEMQDALKLPSAGWVSPPFGDYFWNQPLLERNDKLSEVFRPWKWKGRPTPPAELKAVKNFQGEKFENSVGNISGIEYLHQPGAEYALVQVGTQSYPCQASSLGGNIDVTCTAPAAGTLVVAENAFDGWQAWRDGKPAVLRPGNWLSVDAPAGTHTYSFRYQPWDAPVGLALSLVGVGLLAWIGFKRRKGAINDSAG